jgi:hypothetical protein
VEPGEVLGLLENGDVAPVERGRRRGGGDGGGGGSSSVFAAADEAGKVCFVVFCFVFFVRVQRERRKRRRRKERKKKKEEEKGGEEEGGGGEEEVKGKGRKERRNERKETLETKREKKKCRSFSPPKGKIDFITGQYRAWYQAIRSPGGSNPVLCLIHSRTCASCCAGVSKRTPFGKTLGCCEAGSQGSRSVTDERGSARAR